MYLWHHVNAFEDGDRAVVDFVRYEDARSLDWLAASGHRRGRALGAVGTPVRARIGREVDLEVLAPIDVEFPRVAPAVEGARHRFAYFARVRESEGLHDSITKLDFETGEARRLDLGPELRDRPMTRRLRVDYVRRMRSLLVLGLLAASVAEAKTPTWEELYREDGITVWGREVPGSSFVEFRGRTIFDASIKKILAVLNDQKRKTEWMYQCVDNTLIAARGLGKLVIYNRTGSTVPLVADRDVVVETDLEWSIEDRRVLITAKAIDDPRMPPVDGVVRMPKLELQWELRAVALDRTEVTYRVAADPGGMLPAWVVNMVSKKIPYNTLFNLRRQTKKDYSEALAFVEGSFEWAAVERPYVE